MFLRNVQVLSFAAAFPCLSAMMVPAAIFIEVFDLVFD